MLEISGESAYRRGNVVRRRSPLQDRTKPMLTCASVNLIALHFAPLFSVVRTKSGLSIGKRSGLSTIQS